MVFREGVIAGPQVDAAAKRVVGDTAWAAKDVKGMMKRATDYVHKKWRNDAVLMSIRLTANQTTGNTDAIFTYYSADQEQMLSFMSAIQGISTPMRGRKTRPRNLAGFHRSAGNAIDTAHAQGLNGKQIEEATLEWSSGESCGTGNFAIDNAILPCARRDRVSRACNGKSIRPFGDRKWVPATK